ncbi:MAG: FAD-binding oxidoreductase [Gemmatimonadaceae bacterium]|nr:FAD-binding oxidoreductase [Gemmatimonadaceae bacterium]
MIGPSDFRGVFRSDAEACAVYAEGAGIGRIVPRAVAVPADADDVSALVRWAAETGATLTPRGSGSSMANGAIGPGVIVDLSRLDVIGSVDVERQRIRVGPGAVRDAVDRAARAVGLRFPPHPSSGAYCTVGGMVGTNAAGAETLGFGATRRWITGLECVLADGARVWVRRGEPWPTSQPIVAAWRALFDAWRDDPSLPAAVRRDGVRKESSGYGIADALTSGDLVDLLVGSEGTLAIFTTVECALAPVAGAEATMVAAFPALEMAVDAALQAGTGGAVACELLDRTFLDVARDEASALHIPESAEAVLLMLAEGDNADLAAAAATRLATTAAVCGASWCVTAQDPDAQRTLWHLRHAASPTISRLYPTLASVQVIEDGCVPPAAFPAYVRGVRAILDKHQVPGVIFGHAGDAHAHVNPLIDMRADDWRARLSVIYAEVHAMIGLLGGTPAGEHGDGRLRAPLVPVLWPAPAVAAFRALKAAADPVGLLNPGVILPAADATPFGDVKYDPALPPLPPTARAALDEVAATRSYAGFRLSQLGTAARRAAS